MQSYKHMLQTAFIFYGRERRSVYWSATLINLGLFLICMLIFGSIKTISWIFYLYLLVTIVPQIAITVRRLHDVSSSGKRMFLLLIPVIGWVLLFTYLICDSTPESNMYGDSLKYPKDRNVILSEDAIDEKYKKKYNALIEAVTAENEMINSSNNKETK